MQKKYIKKRLRKVKLVKLDNIDFKTNLELDNIMKIVDIYISRQKEEYEVNKETILYDPEFHITNEPVWYVDIISLETKERFPDAYTTLIISDKEKRLIYIMNDYGIKNVQIPDSCKPGNIKAKDIKKRLKDIEKVKLIKLDKVDFKTNLKLDDIMKITDMYISRQEEKYEINKETILYNPQFDTTNGPVWYVDIIELKTKERFPDAYITLIISDKEKRLIYVMNDHGVLVETF